MADQEAWMELSDLYINQQEWNKAAFCVEELILHSPFNHLYLQRYAEIKYTQVSQFFFFSIFQKMNLLKKINFQGGYENLEMARSYYSQAAKLNPTNVRALYGLFLVSNLPKSQLLKNISMMSRVKHFSVSTCRLRFTWHHLQNALLKRRRRVSNWENGLQTN